MSISSYTLFLLAVGLSYLNRNKRSGLITSAFSVSVLFMIIPNELFLLLGAFVSLLVIFRYSGLQGMWLLVAFLLLVDKIIVFLDLHYKLVGLSFFCITVGVLLSKQIDIKKIFNLSFFFPHIVAGPIIFEEFVDSRSFHERVYDAILKFSTGMVLLEIATVLGLRFELINDATNFNPFVTGFLYLPYLFSNFLGYSLVASSHATLLGYCISHNFDAPGLAHNSKQFWLRWHISLSHFMRCYLFKFLRQKFEIRLAITITLLISGLWHGIGGGYLIWAVWFVILGLIYPKGHNSVFLSTLFWFLISLPAWSFFSVGSENITKMGVNFDFSVVNTLVETYGVKALGYLAISYLFYFIPLSYLFRAVGKVCIIQSEIDYMFVSITSRIRFIMLIVIGFLASENIGVYGEFIYANF